MFKVSDYVIYQNKGVCQVEKIGTLDVSGIDSKRLYYTLSYVFSSGGMVYTAVDNKKVVMRRILKKEEVPELIKEIPEIGQLLLPNEKGKEQIYKDALRTCDIREIIKLVKTLYPRKVIRVADGKKVNQIEDRYLKIAEDSLYDELAITLQIDRDEVESYISDQLEPLKDGEKWWAVQSC